MKINERLVVGDEPKIRDGISNFSNELIKLLSIKNKQNLSTTEIEKRYIEAMDQDINLFCSYTTRLDGFLDILLSRQIICSKEVHRILGKVNTHRGDTMGEGTNLFSMNDYISFSTGLVSYAYSNGSDESIQSIEEYTNGLGFFLPLETALQQQEIKFSHCSSKGGIKDYDLNRENIFSATHKARKEGDLFDDGYGNIFEIGIAGLYKDNEFHPAKTPIVYPNISLSQGIIAIPENMKKEIGKLLEKKQKYYRQLLEEINKMELDLNKPHIITIKNRKFRDITGTIEFIPQMLKPINLDTLPIFWYKQKNLNIALQYLSIT